MTTEHATTPKNPNKPGYAKLPDGLAAALQAMDINPLALTPAQHSEFLRLEATLDGADDAPAAARAPAPVADAARCAKDDQNKECNESDLKAKERAIRWQEYLLMDFLRDKRKADSFPALAELFASFPSGQGIMSIGGASPEFLGELVHKVAAAKNETLAKTGTQHQGHPAPAAHGTYTS